LIHSMTGFGEGRTTDGGVTYRVEIRSVNNRYFKASIKVPESFQRFEAEIDRLLRERMGRGSVMFSLRVRDENPASAYEINEPLVKEYVRRLKDISADYGAGITVDMVTLLNVPGVLLPPNIDEARLAAQFEIVKGVMGAAVEQLLAMRAKEGESILRDLQAHCEEIRGKVADIAKLAPTVADDYRKRLTSRMGQLMGGVEGGSLAPHEDAIAREVALYAERCDISEEISRINSHLEQFDALCAAPEETGRKLDFLTQELLREANTIGSKANNVEIGQATVAIKAAIDRIKEQVQNVE